MGYELVSWQDTRTATYIYTPGVYTPGQQYIYTEPIYIYSSLFGDPSQARVCTEFPGQMKTLVLLGRWGSSATVSWAVEWAI